LLRKQEEGDFSFDIIVEGSSKRFLGLIRRGRFVVVDARRSEIQGRARRRRLSFSPKVTAETGARP